MIKTSLYLYELDFNSKRQSLMVGGYLRQNWMDIRLKASENEDDKYLVTDFAQMLIMCSLAFTKADISRQNILFYKIMTGVDSSN